MYTWACLCACVCEWRPSGGVSPEACLEAEAGLLRAEEGGELSPGHREPPGLADVALECFPFIVGLPHPVPSCPVPVRPSPPSEGSGSEPTEDTKWKFGQFSPRSSL